MAWIKQIEEADAEGDLKELYERISGKRGKLSNIMAIQSLNPKAMEAHLDLYLATVFGRSGLSRAERELIGVVVSAVNGCEYCVQHHARALNHYWKDQTKLAMFVSNFNAVELSDREEALIAYSQKLTRGPRFLKEMDINELRNVGFEDDQILDLNLIAAYFNFVNRIALGLGVEHSRDEVEGYEY